jgi:hypothetical protein
LKKKFAKNNSNKYEIDFNFIDIELAQSDDDSNVVVPPLSSGEEEIANEEPAGHQHGRITVGSPEETANNRFTNEETAKNRKMQRR